MPTLSERLEDYIAAGFSGIWIHSHEHEDALTELATLCHARQWALATWDIDTGLQLADNPSTPNTGNDTTDPLAALHALAALGQNDQTALLVLPNFHRFLSSTEIIQAMAHQLSEGRRRRRFILVLSPVVQIPIELEKQFILIDHDLPDKDQLLTIGRAVATEAGELPDGDELDQVLAAAAGLTRMEAENAFSLSLVRQGKVQPASIWELKTAALRKSGLLQLHRGDQRFSDLGGLEGLKAFCLKAMQPRTDRRVRPRGLLLLGIPGTGKSAFAKALGAEVGRPTLTLDVGQLMGSLVGQTEQNIRQALRIADAMAPAILFVDELEKALAGASSAHQGDSGVSSRLFGTLLTWLSDHGSDVFFIGTCNDIAKLPPEFSRAERFDGVFFLDLPGEAQKKMIWRIYQDHFDLNVKQPLPGDSRWTGAEIRACCRLAALLDLPLKEAASYVVPVAVTAAESVERLRQWAGGRCLDSETGTIYECDGQRTQPSARSSRRQVHRN